MHAPIPMLFVKFWLLLIQVSLYVFRYGRVCINEVHTLPLYLALALALSLSRSLSLALSRSLSLSLSLALNLALTLALTLSFSLSLFVFFLCGNPGKNLPGRN